MTAIGGCKRVRGTACTPYAGSAVWCDGGTLSVRSGSRVNVPQRCEGGLIKLCILGTVGRCAGALDRRDHRPVTVRSSAANRKWWDRVAYERVLQ